MMTSQENPELIRLGHELNNVWTGLIGSAELLQMTLPADAPEQEFITLLLDGIAQGEAITKKIRAIAHGEEEPASDNPRPDIINTGAVSVGNPTLDNDNRQLETMLHHLQASESAEEAAAIADALLTACRRHFYREEQLMLHCPDYPFRDNHCRTHRAMLAKLQTLRRRLSADHDRQAIREVAELLPIHILGMDSSLKPCIQQRPELACHRVSMPSDDLLRDYFASAPIRSGAPA